jgi:PAS domain S-box-containing protein
MDSKVPLHILVVEDDESVATSIAIMFRKKLSAEVTLAADCASARKTFAEGELDLVTVDYQLPDGDGISLLEEFTSKDGHPPVILVTGHGDELTAARSMEAGAAGYVIKDRLMASSLYQAAKRALEFSQAVTEIRESEAKYRFLAEHMNDVLWMTDLDLKLTYISPSVGQVLGFTAEKFMEQPLSEQLTTGSLEAATERLTDELLHDGERDPNRIEVLELHFHHVDGGTRCLETSMSFVRDEENKPVGLLGLSRDITRRRDVESALADSEELFRQMAQVANDAIVVIDAEGRCQYWNPSAEAIFGYTSKEILEKEIAPLLSVPAQLESNLEAVRKFGLTGTGPWFGRMQQFPSVDKKGRIVPVEVSSAPFKTGGQWRAVLNIRDVSERTRAEETIRRNAEELKDLIDVAAHELRHPATIFKGYASILMRYGNDLETEMAREAIESIDRAADRLTVLINKLFDTSRIERGSLTLELTDVRPRELIEAAVKDAKDRGTANPFSVRCAEGEWRVTADSEKIVEVLKILIDNAITHSPKGAKIDCSCKRDSGGTIFEVADRGPGISEEARERIFERFYQEEQADHHSKPGMGLGLYIARTYITAHGGWICMTPRKGGGSVFRFAIPDTQT